MKLGAEHCDFMLVSRCEIPHAHSPIEQPCQSWGSASSLHSLQDELSWGQSWSPCRRLFSWHPHSNGAKNDLLVHDQPKFLNIANLFSSLERLDRSLCWLISTFDVWINEPNSSSQTSFLVLWGKGPVGTHGCRANHWKALGSVLAQVPFWNFVS